MSKLKFGRMTLAIVTGILLSTSALTAMAGGKWMHTVNVGGIDSYPGDVERVGTFSISVNARVDYKGNSKGKVEWDALDGTALSFGTVQCLVVVDNRAYLTYIAEGGAWDFYGSPGKVVIIAFEDNGEGHGADPDRQSFIYAAEPGYSTDCSWLPNAEFIQPGPVEWLHGNVQVR